MDRALGKLAARRDPRTLRLARYLEPTMERAFADMVKRYGFTPKTPVVLEIYADADDRPRLLYERLGFRPVRTVLQLTRTP